jgi:hypothetical protein
MGIYDSDGKIQLTASPGSGWVGRYAPDGSWYYTSSPGTGFVGAYAPDGSLYITNATGSTELGLYAADGSLRVTSGDDNNGALKVSGINLQALLGDTGELPAWLSPSRAGGGMLTDSTGKVTWAPENLLLNSATLSTQNVTTIPVSYIVSFYGTGTITLSGTSTDGPIVGTGAGDRVYLKFTPTAGTLTLTVSGSVTSAQLERVTYQTTPRAYNATTGAAYYGPRFDYDPSTLTALGLLLEGTRTNVALWNRDLTNAAWTKTNVTAAKDQTGIDGVASSASKITATAGNGTILQAITLASSARFQSAYVKRVTGSGVVEMTTDNGTTWTAITVTADWTRVSIPTKTLADPTIGFRIVTSGDAIAIDFVQNENGAFASSPIWTTTAAVTRASDVCQIIGDGLLPFQSNYGWAAVQLKTAAVPASALAILSGSSPSNLYLFSGTSNQIVSNNGTTSLNSGVSTVGAFKRGVFAWDKVTPSRRLQATGGSLQSDANTPNIGATTQWVGSVGGSSNFNFMWLQSIALGIGNPSDAELASKLTVDGPY